MRRFVTTVLITATLLAGCSDQPRRTTRRALPSCPEISTALFHVGMTDPRAAAPAEPGACTFTSKQKYGISYGSVTIVRPSTDPYQGQDLDDWADDQLEALSCANGVRGTDGALPHGRTCYERLTGDRAGLTLAGYLQDAVVRTTIEFRVPGAGGEELEAGTKDAGRAFGKQIEKLLGS